MLARTAALMCGLWLIAIATALSQAQLPARVGDLGNIGRVEVRGSTIFTPDAISDALARDFEVAVARHPAAPLGDYLETLRQRCRSGLLHQGFPLAKVDVRLRDADQKIEIVVEEGPRLAMREIRIDSAELVDARALRAILLRKQQVEDPLRAAAIAATEVETETQAVWRPGEPASYSGGGIEQRRAAIQSALAELGFHHCVFEATLLSDFDAKSADMQITIVDCGAPALVEEVIITGLARNTREALLQEIEWKRGTLVTSAQLNRINQRLYASGRFIKHDVRLTLHGRKSDAYRLEIDVLEYPRATPLGQPLTAVEEVLMKHSQWFTRIIDEKLDFVGSVEYEGQKITLIFSPQRGLMLQVRQAETPDAAPLLSFTLSAERLACYVAEGDRHFDMPYDECQFTINCTLELTDGENRDQEPFRLSFSGNVNSERPEGAPPLVTRLVATPAHCLAVAYEHHAVCKLQNGVMTVTSDDAIRQFDAVSGRLLNFANRDADGKTTSRLDLIAGAFDAEMNRLQLLTRERTNAYDAQRALSSLLQFALSEPILREAFTLAGAPREADKPILEPVLRRALEKSLQFDAGDDFRLNKLASDDEQDERFVLDRPTNPSGTVELYARAALPWGDVLFPRESWPATLWRESCLVLAGKPQYAMRELDRLFRSPDTGPLCALATASLVRFIHDDAAKAFAKYGLERLSIADFRNDYEPLLTDEAVVGLVLQHLLEWLRTLDDEERAALSRWLLAKHSDEFIEATRILSDEPDQSAANLLPPVLDRVWELGLRAKVEAALREIAP